MTFWSFVLSKICGRAASGGNMLVESIFSKWDFVQVLLLNAEEQNTFCHKTKKINASFVLPSFTKKWKHQNVGNSSKWLLGVFWDCGPLISFIPWSSTFQDSSWVKFPTLGTLRMSNSLPACASLGLISVGALAHLSMVCPRQPTGTGGWMMLTCFLSLFALLKLVVRRKQDVVWMVRHFTKH